ncbi:amidase [Streptomyces sp. NPDC047515]|uniref:amidase n=1 Tax=Streptomyces sp. NPDC047515 TaxID=3155380 RepID=UPI0033FF1A22
MQQPFATLAEAASALRAGTIGSRELVDAALADAGELDPLLGVYVTRFPEQARAAARAADARSAAERGPLHGLPLAVKDNLATVEGPVTAQSRVHDRDWWRGLDAPAVARLRTAGAVVLGKTTMAEYAMGRPDPAHSFPVPRNPWDPERWTGGSSTGNGAGIAAGLFLGALGTDTSGSVRLPAALCGTTGLKTTYGLLPTKGCVPLSPSQDVLGPMAVSARDCALLLAALTGQPQRPAAPEEARGLRIGVPYALTDGPGITEECRTSFRASLRRLSELGAEIREFDFPEFGSLLAVNAVTMLAEAFAVHGGRLAADWDGHGRGFRRLTAAGAVLPAHLYLRTQYSRERLTARLLERMDGPAGVDLIATPTWPAPARPYAQEAAPGDELNLTAVWNPTGFPALVLPMGADPAGLPLSLQLVGRPYAENTLLGVGEAFQRATAWHLRRAAPDPRYRPTPLRDPDSAGAIEDPPVPSATSTVDSRTSHFADTLAAVGITPGPADLAAVQAVAHALLKAGEQPAA